MAHISNESRGVRAKFLKNDDKILIEFADPAYAKAENILFDPQSNDVHAVLHEGMFLIGRVPDDMASDFKVTGNVELCADHYTGEMLRLGASISLMKH